jgi:Zn-dependent protease with chaperone function
MAIDFFGAQDKARRNTGLLVFLFVLAVFFLTLLTNLVVCIGLDLLRFEQIRFAYQQKNEIPWFLLPTKAIFLTTLSVLGGITLMVTLKWVSLRDGGRAVAESLGGERVTYSNATAQQRVLLNVVAEMALAANVPMPPVYVLPESAINAFAAGYSPADAVIGVTAGCIEQLNRDELQGVVAHEFSHILNGDMRLNIRLMAWLFGILCIADAGRLLLEHSRGVRISDSDGNKSNPLPLIGLALLVIGWLGVFFGNMIKAAVSRQREFLADASAVQFTRNPDGIADALKKIAVNSQHGELKTAGAEDASHMFFSSAISNFLGMFATHPPLNDRIKRIDPSWDGRFVVTKTAKKTAPPTPENAEQPFNAAVASSAAIASLLTQNVRNNAESSVVINDLPKVLLNGCQHFSSASALYLSTLLQPEYLARQMFLIRELGNADLLANVDRLCDQVMQLEKQQQLRLLQLAIPALKEQTASQFRNFQQLVHDLVQVDRTQELYEWIVQSWLLHCVGVHWQWHEVSSAARTESFAKRQPEILCLLSVISAHATPLQHAEESAANRQLQAWRSGLAILDLPANTANPNAGFVELTAALPHLLSVGPLLKRQIWQMLQAAIYADSEVTSAEQLLLQAFALLLEIPAVKEQTNSAT